MKNLESPSMIASSYGGVLNTAFEPPWEAASWPNDTGLDTVLKNTVAKIQNPCNEIFAGAPQPSIIKLVEENMRRLVKIIIVDPNENVPLDKAALYVGNEELTDLTDEEIWYDIELKSILKTHNTYRVTVKDKKASKTKEKDEFLEEIRIKDLKMVILTIAAF